MTHWRPGGDDWKNPYYDDIEPEQLTPVVMGKGIGFEEGADALLEG